MSTLFYDARWDGAFGIGRYSSEIRRRLPGAVQDLSSPGDPLSPAGLLNWERTTFLPGRSRQEKRTLLSPSFTPSLTWAGHQAITVHDLIHLDVPDEASRAKSLYYRHVVLPAVRRNAVTFTVSEFSKNRIVEWSGVEPDRIVVTGNAADTRFTPSGKTHDIGHPYVLYVRNSKPHKNSTALIEAFAQLVDADETRLILSGEADAVCSAAAVRLGVSDRVIFAGRIPEDDLPSYYRGAAVVAFPSLYEGFGIPAVEAMACGTPVVASNTTSLPEVVGEAALLVDPHSVESIADGLALALTDHGTRSRLEKAGPQQAAKFSWDEIATKVSAALA